jgi:hypothetical protein
MAPENHSDFVLNPLVPCPLSLYISAIDFGPGATPSSNTEWVATAAKYLGLVRCQLIHVPTADTSSVDAGSADAGADTSSVDADSADEGALTGLEQQSDSKSSVAESAAKPCRCGSLTHSRVTHRECPWRTQGAVAFSPWRTPGAASDQRSPWPTQGAASGATSADDIEVKPCKCGSLTHLRTSHKDCPLKK